MKEIRCLLVFIIFISSAQAQEPTLTCLANATIPIEGCGGPILSTICFADGAHPDYRIIAENKQIVIPQWSYDTLFSSANQTQPMVAPGYVGANMSSCESFAADIGKHFCGRISDNGYSVNSQKICEIYCKQVEFKRQVLSNLCSHPSGGSDYCSIYGTNQAGYDNEIMMPSIDSRMHTEHGICPSEMLEICNWQGAEVPFHYYEWVVTKWPLGKCDLVSDLLENAGELINATCASDITIPVDPMCEGGPIWMNVCQDTLDAAELTGQTRDLDPPLFSYSNLYLPFPPREVEPWTQPTAVSTVENYSEEFLQSSLMSCAVFTTNIANNFCNRLGYAIANSSIVCDFYCKTLDFIRQAAPDLCFEEGGAQEPYCTKDISGIKLSWDLQRAFDMRIHPDKRNVCKADMLNICDWSTQVETGMKEPPGEAPRSYKNWVTEHWPECNLDKTGPVECAANVQAPVAGALGFEGDAIRVDACVRSEDATNTREQGLAGSLILPLFSGFDLFPGRWGEKTFETYLTARIDTCENYRVAINNLCQDLGGYAAASTSIICPIYEDHLNFLRERTPNMCFVDGTRKEPYCSGTNGQEQLDLDRAEYLDLTKTPTAICFEDMFDLCEWGGVVPQTWVNWLLVNWPQCQKCGDGVKSEGEECDDYNEESGDGCSAECSVEMGYECSSGYDSGSHNTYGDSYSYSPPTYSYFGEKRRSLTHEVLENLPELLSDLYTPSYYGSDLSAPSSYSYHGVSFDVCSLLDSPGIGQAFVQVQMTLVGLSIHQFTYTARLDFRAIMAAIVSLTSAHVLLETWSERVLEPSLRRVAATGAMDVDFRLLVSAADASRTAATLVAAQSDGTMAARFAAKGMGGITLLLRSQPTIQYAMNCFGFLVNVGNDTASCSGEITLDVCSPSSSVNQTRDVISRGALAVTAFSLASLSSPGQFEAVTTRIASCAVYAQDIQEQVCQRVGAFNVSANICEFYCKHMAHLRKAMPNMCHPNEGANFCASDQAYADPLLTDPFLDLRLQESTVCKEDVLQMCDWKGEPPAAVAASVDEEWAGCAPPLKCATGMQLPVDDQCNLDVQFNFCVEQDAELGFKQVVQAGSVPMPFFSVDTLFDTITDGLSDLVNTTVPGLAGRRAEDELDIGYVGDVAGTRMSSCEAFKRDVSDNVCQRLGNYSASDAVCATYCKYVKFLNTVTSKMCDEAGSVTDKCASFSDSEQYAAFTARLTDARQHVTEICRDDMLKLCAWGAAGPPDRYRRWVQEKWPADCVNRKLVQQKGVKAAQKAVQIKEAENLATAVTVTVAVTVGAVVGATVTSSVAGAVAGSLAAAVAGAGGGTAGASMAAAGADRKSVV